MEENTSVRVRFAPSPTGALHIGGARTAYFNWLFARQQKGTFILRIDDTDTSRSTEESYRQILDSFHWLGIQWDEGPDIGGPYGPYRQSQRQHIYEEEIQRLIDKDLVYPCFCSPELLAEDRRKAQAAGRASRYVGRCAHLSKAERDARIAAGEKPVYRLRSPEAGETVVHDIIRGDVSFSNQEIDDFIVWKADGTPTYHFASCVDDTRMQVSHIIRAEEHLSNTPKHIVLFAALGAKVPQFAHVPMILAPDRSKLSKRHGATSVSEYRDAGVLPQALINYLLLLGFSPGEDKEMLPRETAVELFDLQRVAKHAAIYDIKKLEWLNACYLRAMNVDDIVDMIFPELIARKWVEEGASRETLAWIRTLVQALQQRSRNFDDILTGLTYYFEPVGSYDEKGAKKHFADAAVCDRLETVVRAISELQPFTVPVLERSIRALIEESGTKAGMWIHPIRLALTGITVGPGLFDVMAMLGRAECTSRLSKCAARLRNGEVFGA